MEEEGRKQDWPEGVSLWGSLKKVPANLMGTLSRREQSHVSTSWGLALGRGLALGEAAFSSRGQLLMRWLAGGPQPLVFPGLGRNKSLRPKGGLACPSQHVTIIYRFVSSNYVQEEFCVRRGSWPVKSPDGDRERYPRTQEGPGCGRTARTSRGRGWARPL